MPRLTFQQVEEILGGSLPDAARKYSAWWANSRTEDSHTWAHLWLDAGWEKESLNLADQWVTFRRVRAGATGANDGPELAIDLAAEAGSSPTDSDSGNFSPQDVDRRKLVERQIRERRGQTQFIGDEESPKTWVTVLSERMAIRLEEGLDREEKIDSFFAYRHEYDYVPNGKLTLRIDDTLGGSHRRQWSDGKAVLENRLNTVVAGMVTAAEATRAVREANERREREWKEEERRRKEHEQRRRQQEARAQDFEQKLTAWERAERIRAFVAAVRAHAIRRDGAIAPDGELDRWIAWALRRADRIDPVVTDHPERRWPPPEGQRVKLSNQGYPWWLDGSEGTPVLPPGPVNRSADGTAEPMASED